MRVVLDQYFNDLEQRCLTEGCDFVVGPYDEEWTGGCPRCRGRLGFFRAFGTQAERQQQVSDPYGMRYGPWAASPR